MAAHVRLKNEFTEDENAIISWDGSISLEKEIILKQGNLTQNNNIPDSGFIESVHGQ